MFKLAIISNDPLLVKLTQDYPLITSTSSEPNIFIIDVDEEDLGPAIHAHHPDAYLIYVGTSPQIDIEAYELNVISYLRKPVSKQSLDKALNSAKRKIKQERCFVQTPYGESRIEIENILYVNIDKRYLCYHLRDGSTVNSQTMRASFVKTLNPNLLADARFCLVGSGLLINVDEIKELYIDHLVFTNGETIHFPRAHHEKIQEVWKRT